ncbi:Galactose oxidase [Paramyrothecium foliicola]|nr:Galactose oxidase [Paramyrothecium foliicola]
MARAFWLLSLPFILFSELVASQNFPYGNTISRTGWTATASSSQTGNEPGRVLDGSSATLWHSGYSPTVANLPHEITIDMKQRFVVNGISYQPRQDGNSNGIIGRHRIAISDNGQAWSTVAEGIYLSDNTVKYSFFTVSTARYVRITALSEIQGQQFASIAEVNVYTPVPAVSLSNFAPVPPSLGRWGATIDLPIVPAAASITADDIVVFWSAFRADEFSGGNSITYTATYNPSNKAIQNIQVTNIQHDMFCPGTSLDADGVVVVTGGNDVSKTSKYNPSTGGWTAAALMQRSRGYQSQTTIGDGRIFVIGGSWSGGRGSKHGEIYNTQTNTWTRLDGCNVTRIQTNEAAGPYRSDNHAWLFAWKSNLVFNAGPSRAMTWFNVSGTGSWVDAGLRASDPDAMCAVAAMYDAEQGLIVSAGGSPAYEDSTATKNTHIIKLNAVNTPATVTKVADMTYARAYANSVILPDGKVLVTGGQSYAKPFTDTNAALPAELFDPVSNTWKIVAPINVPRTYHSVALLLPDATVIAGGGGLCGRGCRQNHADAQIWTPPYLLNSDGTAATRPTIVSVSSNSVSPGGILTITTNVASTFSLIRYGSTTHTVNTDQRRVVLKPTADGLTYTATLPSDPGVLLPGYWMLFALSESGVPSVAKTIKVLLS